MTDEKITQLKKTATEILTSQRMDLINKHPFVGTIAMNLNLVPVRDARCSTAMTDGNSIYFDIAFLSRLTPDEITFVLGHEVWHVVMMHFLRGKDLKHELFNIAADMEVNQVLDADGFVSPEDVIFPNKRHGRKCEFTFDDGLSAEEYYEYLLKQRNTEFNEMSKKAVKSKAMGSGLSGQFDSHFDKDKDQDKALEEAMKANPNDKYGPKGKDEDFQPVSIKSENEQKNAMNRIRENVVAAAQSVERSRGSLPSYIKKHVEKLLDSKLPWKELLANFITTSYFNKINWNRPNRRFVSSGTYLPSHTGDMLRIAVGIDTSGSCRNDCEKFLAELSGIIKNFDGYELHIIQCDTEVKNYNLYNEENPLDPKEGIDFEGWGGTELHPIFDYIDQNDLEVDAVVMFTDGMCEEFKEETDLPILWAITGNHHCENIKVGEKVYIK